VKVSLSKENKGEFPKGLYMPLFHSPLIFSKSWTQKGGFVQKGQFISFV